MNLKEKIKEKLIEKGADLSKFKFRYYKESPYQKKRDKSEFVQSECWIYPNGTKNGHVITEKDFNHKPYSDNFLDMILEESNYII